MGSLAGVLAAEVLTSGEPASVIAMVVRQLRGVLEVQSARDRRVGLRMLQAVRGDFARQGRWYRVRYRVLEIADSSRDLGLLKHLYFGTPFPAARQWFLHHLGTRRADLPESYDWNPGRASRENRHWLDVATGRDELNASLLKPGQLSQHARSRPSVRISTNRPAQARFSPGSILDEHYNPHIASQRVAWALQNLRRAIAEARAAHPNR